MQSFTEKLFKCPRTKASLGATNLKCLVFHESDCIWPMAWVIILFAIDLRIKTIAKERASNGDKLLVPHEKTWPSSRSCRISNVTWAVCHVALSIQVIQFRPKVVHNHRPIELANIVQTLISWYLKRGLRLPSSQHTSYRTTTTLEPKATTFGHVKRQK